MNIYEDYDNTEVIVKWTEFVIIFNQREKEQVEYPETYEVTSFENLCKLCKNFIKTEIWGKSCFNDARID